MNGSGSESSPVEADERFPSGPWVGFWLQKPLTGRQWMRDVWLKFSQNKVDGGGEDLVGEFVFEGDYDTQTGHCRLVKKYVGLHQVEYNGHNDGDGHWLWGVWTMDQATQRGGFHLWPKGVSDPTDTSLQAEQDVPGEELATAKAFSR
jgi:hypothetical protein